MSSAVRDIGQGAPCGAGNRARPRRVWQDWDAPFRDLLGLVRPLVPGPLVLDVGCGTGEHARELHDFAGARATVAIDPDPSLVLEAGRNAVDGLRFLERELMTWRPYERFDLAVANAVLQSLPDHHGAIARLRDLLTPGGQLAIQIPDNAHTTAFTVAAELAGEPPFSTAFGGRRPRWGTLAPEEYAVLLDRLGFAEQHVELRVYLQHLPSRRAFVGWVQGSALAWYKRQLPDHQVVPFVDAYRERLTDALCDDEPFVFASRRLLIWGRL